MSSESDFLTAKDHKEMLEVMGSSTRDAYLSLEGHSEDTLKYHYDEQVMMNESTGQHYLTSEVFSHAPSNPHQEQRSSRLISSVKFKRKPRKPKEIFLKLFRRMKNPRKKVNKEFLRMKLIRGQKGLTRNVLENKKSSRSLLNPTLDTSEACELWNRFKQSCKQNKHISALAETASGPLTDGKSKRKNSNGFKTFSDPFCKAYFENACIRKNWFLFVQLLFINCSVQKLKEKFEVACCEGEHHSDDCYELWDTLKEYLEYSMFEYLELDPWFEDIIL